MRAIPCLWIGSSFLILPEKSCRVSRIPVQIPTGFFMEPDTVSLKFAWENKGPRIARAFENDRATCFTSKRQLQVRNLKTAKPHSLRILESRKPSPGSRFSSGLPQYTLLQCSVFADIVGIIIARNHSGMSLRI